MHRIVDGEDRMQQALLPHSLEDYVSEENPVRVIEVFIDELDLAALGFAGMTPAATGRPAYHPATMLKIYLYGYLNRLQSSRRLERETQRNIELMWLPGRLALVARRARDDDGKSYDGALPRAALTPIHTSMSTFAGNLWPIPRQRICCRISYAQAGRSMRSGRGSKTKPEPMQIVGG